MSEQFREKAPSTQPADYFHTVCKRVIHADPRYYPQAEYQGKTIHFCTEYCLEAFLADPDRFYCAHSTPGSRK